MSSRIAKLVALATLMLSLALVVLAGDKPQSFTGKVSDAMCGKAHMMSGSDAECTRACVGKGSKYALVVGDKVYTLDASDKAVLGTLDKLAGGNAKISGMLNGDTIQVASAAASK